MSIQLYISGEPQRRFATTTDLVLYVRSRWIDDDPAVAPALDAGAPASGSGARGATGRSSSAGRSSGGSTDEDYEFDPVFALRPSNRTHHVGRVPTDEERAYHFDAGKDMAKGEW